MKTILVTGARAPVALHWARVLSAAGHRVILADSAHFPMSRFTRFKALYLRLPSPRIDIAAYARALADAVGAHAVDLVVPTCEEVFFLAAARDLHGAAIPLLAPPFALLAQAHDKFAFAAMARGFGADPPPTGMLQDPASLDQFRRTCGDHVFKPVWSRFAERVMIRPQWPALQAIVPTQADPWVAQPFLPGEELCCWALALEGRVRAHQAYRGLYRAGLGASLAFEPVDDPVIARFAAGFAEATRWTGQLSFDFRRDGSGRLSVIECNPRATSGIHYFAGGDGLADALFGLGTASASVSGPMTLPLAMLVYGLPAALRNGTFARFRADFGAMADIGFWPRDRSNLPGQALALAEIACIALRRGIGLKAAATADTEWNGETLAPRQGA